VPFYIVLRHLRFLEQAVNSPIWGASRDECPKEKDNGPNRNPRQIIERNNRLGFLDRSFDYQILSKIIIGTFLVYFRHLCS